MSMTPRKPVSGNTSGESSPANVEYSKSVPVRQETFSSTPSWTPGSIHDPSVTSYSEMDAGGRAWQDNTSSCGVCKIKFRKRDLSRRHHCRVCGLCVCGDCSPNKVVVDGFRGPQRVCNPCVRVASSPRERQLREQATQLAQRLRELQDPETMEPGMDREPVTVEEALHMAESALLPLAVSRERAVGALRDAGERLWALNPNFDTQSLNAGESLAEPPAGGLEEAAEYLERAIDPAEARLKDAEALAAREAQKRAELEARVLQAEAAAKLMVGADGGGPGRSTWRSLAASTAQEASFAGVSPRNGNAGEERGHDKCTSDKCTPAACVVM